MKRMFIELSLKSKTFLKKWNEKKKETFWKLILKEIEPKFCLGFKLSMKMKFILEIRIFL